MTPKTESKSILDNPTVLERAIIYARVSTDEQAESGTSIDNQVEKSLAYAASRNLQVVGIFKEDYTGKVLDRPELIKVRKLLQTGQADNIIVYKTNRLDRSEWGLNLLILLQEFKQFGVSLHYSQSGRCIDLNNPIEALMESISGWQAGEDHRETVTKLHEGRVKRANDGYVVPHGNAPYGYKPVKGDDKRWYFEIVEEEARIVRLIFTWYILGDETGQALSQNKIADKLNLMGIPTRKSDKWKHGTVSFILGNETYCGLWHYGKRQSKNKRRPTSESIPVEVPPIIDRELWGQAQEKLEENKAYARRNRKPGRYLLSNRVTCGECHYKMFGVTKQVRETTYSYYVCRNRHMTKREKLHECTLPSFDSHLVDSKVWDRLETVSKDRKQLEEGLRGYQAQQESKVEPIRRELAYVEELIKDKTAEWEGAYLDQKLLTSERAKARKALEIDQLEQVLNELEKRKANLLAQFEDKSLTDEQIIGTVAFASQVADDMQRLRELEAQGQDDQELKEAVYEAKRRLLAVLDVQITLFLLDGKKKARIDAKYCPDGDVLPLELGNTCTAIVNRQNWLSFSEVIDLE